MVQSRIVIKTNAAEVAKNLSRRIKKLQQDGKDVTREVAKFGKSYAQSIAPVDTGRTIRAITWTKGKSPASAAVVFGDGHPDRRGRIKGKYGLTYYMNYVGNPGDWRSGNPRFINATSDEVKQRFGKGMRRVVNSFVNGK